MLMPCICRRGSVIASILMLVFNLPPMSPEEEYDLGINMLSDIIQEMGENGLSFELAGGTHSEGQTILQVALLLVSPYSS